ARSVRFIVDLVLSGERHYSYLRMIDKDCICDFTINDMETMIDSLVEVTIFDKVASAGSLTGAANELGLSLAVVSKRLATLEARMGVRLLNRTTRRQSMTQEGERFHLHCVRIL